MDTSTETTPAEAAMVPLDIIILLWRGILWVLLSPYRGWKRKRDRRLYVETLRQKLPQATTYEEWSTIATDLDDMLPEHYAWKHDISSDQFHYRAIQERSEAIKIAIDNQDRQVQEKLFRSALVRSMCGITNPRLYNYLYGGTKLLIQNYIDLMVHLIDRICNWPDRNGNYSSSQAKMDTVDRSRKALGRTALVLQGGSIFALYHLGVMKALHHQGLLPRIILGTSTGALMAALVGIHTDDELPNLLSGQSINIDAFRQRAAHDGKVKPEWFEILFSRIKRYFQSGLVLDREALEQCVEANVGNMTFDEAHKRTDRMLSIAISCDAPGTPNCLNYLTAPNVLIRTAALASNETDPVKAPAMIREKSRKGEIREWALNDESPRFRAIRLKRGRPSAMNDRNTPLHRISELWNVNHYIISQARPYMVPLLKRWLRHSERPNPSRWHRFKTWFYKLVLGEIKLRVRQIDTLFGWPRNVRRFIVDENIPGPSITLLPEVGAADFAALLKNPTQEEIDRWILMGERSVWPAATALHVRCDIELELERQYAEVRWLPPVNGSASGGSAVEGQTSGSLKRKARPRSGSTGTNPLFTSTIRS